MVNEYLLIFCALGEIALAFLAWCSISQLDKQRTEWNAERSKLLDRIQAGSFIEYKAQERADTPITRREKDPLLKKLESEPWL